MEQVSTTDVNGMEFGINQADAVSSGMGTVNMRLWEG